MDILDNFDKLPYPPPFHPMSLLRHKSDTTERRTGKKQVVRDEVSRDDRSENTVTGRGPSVETGGT